MRRMPCPTTEVEKYETKIKDALLRRDSNLSTVSSALKEIMAGSVEVNGKNMYLSDFGIETLSYFTAAENEKNAYHIDGDADDSSTSGNADKLKSMISSDPDTVVSFFSGLFKNLYTKMSDLSKSVEGYRSYGNFYDDKKMKSDYDDYTDEDIRDLEEKLNDYEDKWYSKFSKMETALAKLQSNSSAVTELVRRIMIWRYPMPMHSTITVRCLTASPAELTLMLYEGAIKFCNIAEVAVEEKRCCRRHMNNIRKVQNIIGYLHSTLDMKYPEVSKDFDQYLRLICPRDVLVEANVKKG